MGFELLPLETGVSFHYNDIHSISHAESSIYALLSHLNESAQRPIVYMCIGSDKATGDCLGPLVGARLKIMLPAANIFGTLENPVHAVNLPINIREIQGAFRHPFIVVVDACLGNAERIGFINIKPGSLLPGSAMHKNLPDVGDFHISGVVNAAGSFSHLILQNTRLFLVDQMAEIIAKSLFLAHCRFDRVMNHL